jgi:hypothetical protein
MVLYSAGGSDIEIPVMQKGIEIVNVPFSGKGLETIQVQWRVKGAENEKPLISGVYFGSLPSQADFTKAPLPNDIEKTFMPAYEAPKNAEKILQADLPNHYPVTYAVIYAQIDGQHYWSQEFMIKSE